MSEPNCPMCGEATDEEALASQQLVISAATALLSGDSQTITDCASVATAYDFHLAVTMYVEMVGFIAEMTGSDLDQFFRGIRRGLNAEAAGEV